MTGFTPKEKLTAYQRWEVAAFDEEEHTAAVPPPPIAEAEPLHEAITQEAPSSVALPTAAEIEQMHVEAHEQGYAAGYAEGLQAATSCAEQIHAVMTNLQQAIKVIDQHVADQLLATAVEIANQIVRQSLQLKPELILPVVREAIAALHPNNAHPALFVHPDDAKLIRTHLGEQLTHNNWRILEDTSLTPGGCRVELGASEIDASVETRWRRVIESIGISQEWLKDKP